MTEKPVAAGKSSFDLIESKKVFGIMDIKPHSRFLDLACGTGRYSIEIAQDIGPNGIVYAIDLWREGIDVLNKEIATKRIQNIKAIRADITKRLPLEDDSIDACLLATILHDLSKSEQKAALKQVTRLLKPGGMLHIIEFKKTDRGPGPPVNRRMGVDAVETLVSEYAFIQVTECDVGEFNYLVKFRKTV